ncbi:hypothetical protein MYCTH_103620 [Thermothelomyces thermophilus ATCC 42464]|uniref:Uncharacterized protein n=1 Tax=Thermothelomyces thermophilus (strain ATCC 42464 / BCRC 31852 / DSM 1799) TaxID=573729 RepID=G2QJG9_THET4|nr:uncharacterized protein MYCTH_103620 [Thermothelomyces thermophilus ATCC 42464]AEO59726.1 hypothetical protein MYCTH_103620 [Thermothelomyces thermophilus ATCC 42464]
MGKEPSGFTIPGFICLAPSIYVQDARLTGDGYSAGGGGGGGEAMFSGSSFCLPLGPAAQPSSRRPDTAPPDLIVITSWTGAAAKHVAKYTSAYNALYPGVPILLITTAVSDLVLRSTKQKLKALAPAVAYLLSEEPAAGAPYPARTASSSSSSSSPFSSAFPSQPYHYVTGHPYQPPPAPLQVTTVSANTTSPTRPRFSSLLLHAFSEGGAHKAVLLARAYLSTATAAAAELPVHALILDSTPGTSASLTRLANGVARALPPGTPRLVARGVAAGLVGVSAADEVVWWRDVHRHAVESAAARPASSSSSSFSVDAAAAAGLEEEEKGGGGGPGVGSLVVRFKRTGHCAHAKGAVNGAVYWTAVRRTWEMRVDGGMGLRMGLGRRLSLDSLCLQEEEDDEGLQL